ncbi:MAG: NAD-glutamate dehydrogenase, partial [Endozoicomonadaceae bacterium]|nr:NAD-glutamate dehydrogenase [Endozoicomonadaceae bacterium]
MNQWQGWENLIARLKADLFPKVSSEYHQQLSEFIDSFFSIMSKDELESYSWKDLLGSILYLWNNLINYNDELAADIRIFNPDKETCGWQSKHTIIQIIQLNTPFMVDSIRIRLNDLGILIHQLLNTDIEITTKSSGNKKRSFGVVHIEVNRIESADSLKSLHNSISAVLADARRCVHDYRITKEKIQTITENLSNKALKLPESELNEIKAYLYWILNDNFTFLGFEEVKVKREGQKTIIERPTESLLGLFRENLQEKGAISQCLLEPEMDTDFFSDKSLLSFAKASVRSTVHRPAYPDFIILKQFDKQGQVTGEYRILGLYTSPVFNQSIRHIPILREKYKTVINRSGFLPDSHAGKELAQILQVFPR